MRKLSTIEWDWSDLRQIIQDPGRNGFHVATTLLRLRPREETEEEPTGLREYPEAEEGEEVTPAMEALEQGAEQAAQWIEVDLEKVLRDHLHTEEAVQRSLKQLQALLSGPYLKMVFVPTDDVTSVYAALRQTFPRSFYHPGESPDALHHPADLLRRWNEFQAGSSATLDVVYYQPVTPLGALLEPALLQTLNRPLRTRKKMVVLVPSRFSLEYAMRSSEQAPPQPQPETVTLFTHFQIVDKPTIAEHALVDAVSEVAQQFHREGRSLHLDPAELSARAGGWVSLLRSMPFSQLSNVIRQALHASLEEGGQFNANLFSRELSRGFVENMLLNYPALSLPPEEGVLRWTGDDTNQLYGYEGHRQHLLRLGEQFRQIRQTRNAQEREDLLQGTPSPFFMYVGPPGSGKTEGAYSTALVLSQATGNTYRTIELNWGGLLGSLVGTSEANLDAVLRFFTELHDTVVAMDEIGKKLLTGATGSGRTDPVGPGLVGRFVEWISNPATQRMFKTHGVVFVGTSNLPELHQIYEGSSAAGLKRRFRHFKFVQPQNEEEWYRLVAGIFSNVNIPGMERLPEGALQPVVELAMVLTDLAEQQNTDLFSGGLVDQMARDVKMRVQQRARRSGPPLVTPADIREVVRERTLAEGILYESIPEGFTPEPVYLQRPRSEAADLLPWISRPDEEPPSVEEPRNLEELWGPATVGEGGEEEEEYRPLGDRPPVPRIIPSGEAEEEEEPGRSPDLSPDLSPSRRWTRGQPAVPVVGKEYEYQRRLEFPPRGGARKRHSLRYLVGR